MRLQGSRSSGTARRAPWWGICVPRHTGSGSPPVGHGPSHRTEGLPGEENGHGAPASLSRPPADCRLRLLPARRPGTPAGSEPWPPSPEPSLRLFPGGRQRPWGSPPFSPPVGKGSVTTLQISLGFSGCSIGSLCPPQPSPCLEETGGGGAGMKVQLPSQVPGSQRPRPPSLGHPRESK